MCVSVKRRHKLPTQLTGDRSILIGDRMRRMEGRKIWSFYSPIPRCNWLTMSNILSGEFEAVGNQITNHPTIHPACHPFLASRSEMKKWWTVSRYMPNIYTLINKANYCRNCFPNCSCIKIQLFLTRTTTSSSAASLLLTSIRQYLGAVYSSIYSSPPSNYAWTTLWLKSKLDNEQQ